MTDSRTAAEGPSLPPAASVSPPAVRSRVLSIDALRGFDMFWIIGGDALATRLLGTDPQTTAGRIGIQFEHAAWEGFRFYDLIFPLFLFLVGCVLPYSLAKYADQPSAVYARLVRRGLLLFLLGLVCNNLLQFNWPELRVAGVLQRIGICYTIAALVYLHTGIRGQVITLSAILLGYWAILAWVPVPGGVAGDLSAQGNLSGFIDRQLLPGKIYPEYYGYGDNEGILSTLPAVGTTLLGILAGHVLRSLWMPWRKVGVLAAAGVALLLAGYGWSHLFPIIKNLWTSSFVLVAGGYSLLLLSLFYAVIDVLGYHRWAFFWVVIGCNAITIYVAARFISFREISEYFLGGVAGLTGSSEALVLSAGTLAAKWLFLWYLYRQGTFLRV